MIVRAAGGNRVTVLTERRGKCLGVVGDGPRVKLEFGLKGFAEGDRLGRDHMHQRSALEARKYRRIDFPGDRLVVGENEPAARPAKSLVCRRGDNIGMRKWRRMHSARDKAREMRHVDEKISANGIRDCPEPRKVPIAGIAGAAGDDELRLVLRGKPRDRFHVDSIVVTPNPIGDRLEPFSGDIHRRAMGQMAARGKVEPHKRIARLQQREKHRLVRLAAGIRLHIGEFAVEEPGHALDRQSLGDIDELAAAIIAPAGIALGIFVGQNRALGFEHGLGDDVFRGD